MAARPGRVAFATAAQLQRDRDAIAAEDGASFDVSSDGGGEAVRRGGGGDGKNTGGGKGKGGGKAPKSKGGGKGKGGGKAPKSKGKQPKAPKAPKKAPKAPKTKASGSGAQKKGKTADEKFPVIFFGGLAIFIKWLGIAVAVYVAARVAMWVYSTRTAASARDAWGSGVNADSAASVGAATRRMHVDVAPARAPSSVSVGDLMRRMKVE